uniref:Laccase n=1 Tax=Chenopodium quinoa TaxID=63459 RepID=A0A803LCT1_CHEQI
MELHSTYCSLFLKLTFILAFTACLANAAVHHHEFVIQPTPVNRLCQTQHVMTVNGQFPGPTLEVQNGDTLIIKVTNAGKYDISLHWHGIRQMRNPWADGPEYVTQCPMKPGVTYTYRFTIENQEGTLWWHAHSKWLRATVYGALIIYPKQGSSYPYPKPKREYPLILGEWWNRDPMHVLRQATITGAAANVSDAYTINGQPGDLYPCSSKDTTIFPVEAGETILLRIINAALNQQLFFSIANHQMTVVEADAIYTKPFTTNVVMIGPGQTTNVLVTANQPPGRYYMAATAYSSAPNVAYDNTTTTAILEYKSAACKSKTGSPMRPILPQLPAWNDTNTANAFKAQFRSLSKGRVPIEIHENLFFTINLGLINCSGPSFRCQGPNNTRFTASMNNVSFVFPKRNSIMQALYQNTPGVFTTDFPPVPPLQFDYTGNNTNIVTIEDHPMHLHGYHFFVVGSGKGNFNPRTDPARFNLVDPPERNTIGTTPGGWVAIRFVADNPGVWLMHCHLDVHIGWGLAMAFLVENGVGKLNSVEPPPPQLPQC